MAIVNLPGGFRKSPRMMLPDPRRLATSPGILTEPTPAPDTLVLWLPVGQEPSGALWERLSSIPRAAIVLADGICTVAAVSLTARQRLQGTLARLQRWWRPTAAPIWLLPNGADAEQVGEKQTGLVLAWSPDPAIPLSEAGVRAHWPQARRVQQLAPNLFVIAGVTPAAIP